MSQPARTSAKVVRDNAPRTVNADICNVDVWMKSARRTFVPTTALGAGVDGHEADSIAQIYTPANISAMKSVGLHSLTYRLRTELGVEAWHWNPRGQWSDAAHHCGYWVSNARSTATIKKCYGYRLPRRGNTIDQANNDGYSRLDDGDPKSFWKSNPYLDAHFTGESNARHSQWIVIDLGDAQAISQIHISWGVPFATHYTIEYWNGTNNSVGENNLGQWQRFPNGTVNNGRGGNTVLRLSTTVVQTHYVRLTMTQSSPQAPLGSHDIRDSLGYAIREIALGNSSRNGQFHDAIHHRRDNHQTLMYTSSTDPWHRAQDIDKRVEQPGFDTVFRSGLTNAMPLLTPTGLLYDTPENAANELRFLCSRGYNVQRLELGEEADGQYIAAEDYAALYAQWAKSLHAVDPHIQLGGPSFQTVELDILAWPLPTQKQTWLERVLDYLNAHNRKSDFNFCSFEWYPFDDVCAPTQPQLMRAPAKLDAAIARLRGSLQRAGYSSNTPLLISEYGYSAFAAQAEVDMAGALFNAETVGDFLSAGGETAYLYGYEPDELLQEITCKAPQKAWGNNMILLGDDEHQAKYRTATYYAAWLITHQWLGNASQAHQLFTSSTDLEDSQGRALVASYAVHRPDGLWSVLLLNKDERKAHNVRLRFHNEQKTTRSFNGLVDIYTFSRAQYVWHARDDQGFPAPDNFPVHTTQKSGQNFTVTLPPYALCVVRGRM